MSSKPRRARANNQTLRRFPPPPTSETDVESEPEREPPRHSTWFPTRAEAPQTEDTEVSDASYRLPPAAPLPAEATGAADAAASAWAPSPPSTADDAPAGPSRQVLTRLSAIAALAALVVSVSYVAMAVYLAFTDAWVAPLQLSPDSREVVNMRLQHAKDQRSLASSKASS